MSSNLIGREKKRDEGREGREGKEGGSERVREEGRPVRESRKAVRLLLFQYRWRHQAWIRGTCCRGNRNGSTSPRPSYSILIFNCTGPRGVVRWEEKKGKYAFDTA